MEKSLEQRKEIQALEEIVAVNTELVDSLIPLKDNVAHLKKINHELTAEVEQVKKKIDESQKSLLERDDEIRKLRTNLTLQLQAATREETNLSTQLETARGTVKELQEKIENVIIEKSRISSQLETKVLALEKKISCKNKLLKQLKKLLDEEGHDMDAVYGEDEMQHVNYLESVQDSEYGIRNKIKENESTAEVDNYGQWRYTVSPNEKFSPPFTGQLTVDAPIAHFSGRFNPPGPTHPAVQPYFFPGMFQDKPASSENCHREVAVALSSIVDNQSFTGAESDNSSSTATAHGNKRSLLDSNHVQKRRKENAEMSSLSDRVTVLEDIHDVGGEDEHAAGRCTVVLHSEDAENEENYKHHPYICPCPGDICKWIGPFEHVMHHLSTNHKSITTLNGEDIVFMASNINRRGSHYWAMVQSCFGRQFMLVLEKRDSGVVQHFYASVQLIGLKKEGEKYAYRLELIRGSKRLAWEATSLSTRTTLLNSDRLSFDATTAHSFAKNDNLEINVTISMIF